MDKRGQRERDDETRDVRPAAAVITAPRSLRILSTRSGNPCTSTSVHSIHVSSSDANQRSSLSGTSSAPYKTIFIQGTTH